MEMASSRLSHMNRKPTCLALFSHTSSILSHQLLTSTVSIPTKQAHTNYLRASIPFRPSNCSIPSPVTKIAAMDSSLEVKKKAADVSPCLKGTSIFLVGINSSLKTSLGKMLADTLRYYYFDSDSLVEEAVGGASTAKSFQEMNANIFLESETEVLNQLSSMGRLVVSAGNGAVQCSTNLALLRHGITLWIDVPLDIVATDVIEGRSQFPSFQTCISGSDLEVTNELAVLYNKYREGYATADAIISLQKVASKLACDNFDDITTQDMTLEALTEIEKLTRVKKMMEKAARPF